MADQPGRCLEDLCADLHVMLALAGFQWAAGTLRDQGYDAGVGMQEVAWPLPQRNQGCLGSQTSIVPREGRGRNAEKSCSVQFRSVSASQEAASRAAGSSSGWK